MSSPFIGEIRMFGGNFAPAGWVFCNGQLMPISENDALFTLIGTTYGGDGQSTFGIPDLQGRVPIHAGTAASGTTYQIGEKAGIESVTLTVNQLPAHSHTLTATANNATGTAPANSVLGAGSEVTISPYGSDNPKTALNSQSITSVGGSQPHDNMQPFLAVSYIMSLFGIFPSQN